VAKKQSTTMTLPEAFIPFIIEHLDMFEARIEGETIVIGIKDGGQLPPLPANGHKRTTPSVPPPRPKFIYSIEDRKLDPATAKRYGFSEQRLKVYQAIYDSPKGIQAADVLTKTGLPHGTVQQILHWLRTRKLVKGMPESA
jgi:hypothetical protein